MSHNVNIAELIDNLDHTEAVDHFYEKEAKRSRFARSTVKARRKAILREAMRRIKKESATLVTDTNGEPLRRPEHVGGQETRVDASIKRLRRTDRQTARQQCRDAACDGGETVVTGSLPVQRANVRSLAVAAI